MNDNGKKSGFAIIFAFFTGFLAGAVISLLYAPTSGKDTRKKIRETSIDAKNRTVELVQHASETAKEGVHNLVEQGRENVQDIVNQGKERFHDAGNQVKHAVETGRKFSSEARSKVASSIPGTNDAAETDEQATEES